MRVPARGRSSRAGGRGTGAGGRCSGSVHAVIFTGERPSAEIPVILDAADVLVSPRSRGTNTPLKIYQYLRSGRAIVATRLLTHTQVLDDNVAILTGGQPREFADGILAALADPADGRRDRRARAELAETKYSYDVYLERTREAWQLSGERRARPGGWGRRVSQPGPIRASADDHYSYTALCRPGDGGWLRAAALRRSRLAGCWRNRRSGCSPEFLGRPRGPSRSRRRHGHWTRRPRAGRARRHGDRSRRVRGDAARCPRSGQRRAACPLCSPSVTHTRSPFPRRRVRRRGVPAGADAHARLAALRRRAVPRRRHSRRASTTRRS